MQAHVARIMTRPLLSLPYTLLIQLQAFLLVTLLYLTTWLSFCFFFLLPSPRFTPRSYIHCVPVRPIVTTTLPSSIRPQSATVPIQRRVQVYVSTRHVAMITYAFLCCFSHRVVRRSRIAVQFTHNPDNDARPQQTPSSPSSSTYLRDPLIARLTRRLTLTSLTARR